MKHKIKFFITSLVFLFTFSNCIRRSESTESKGEFIIEKLFTHGECTVYRFKDGGRYIYYSDCSGRISYTVNSGKHKSEIETMNFNNKKVVE